VLLVISLVAALRTKLKVCCISKLLPISVWYSMLSRDLMDIPNPDFLKRIRVYPHVRRNGRTQPLLRNDDGPRKLFKLKSKFKSTHSSHRYCHSFSIMVSSLQQPISTMLPINHLALAKPGTSSKKTKSVTFNDRVKVKKHIHHSNFSVDEIQASWYGKAEENQIKEECRLLAETSQAESRGLEARTPEGGKRRNRVKVACWDAVMNEQDFQFDSGIVDDEAIAIAYRAISYKCQIAASMMGSFDAQAVQEATSRPAVKKASRTSSSSRIPVFASPSRNLMLGRMSTTWRAEST
jgi:hypothetical protein